MIKAKGTVITQITQQENNTFIFLVLVIDMELYMWTPETLSSHLFV